MPSTNPGNATFNEVAEGFLQLRGVAYDLPGYLFPVILALRIQAEGNRAAFCLSWSLSKIARNPSLSRYKLNLRANFQDLGQLRFLGLIGNTASSEILSCESVRSGAFFPTVFIDATGRSAPGWKSGCGDSMPCPSPGQQRVSEVTSTQ